jgi:signal transduction histidine kinase
MTIRLRQLGWALALLPLTITAIVLLVFELVAIGFVAIWIGVPLSIGVIALIRRYADRYRLWATTTLDVPVPRPYRTEPAGGPLSRMRSAFRDPATWRDLGWLWVNATAGMALCATQIGLFFGGLGYLSLPFWWHFLPEDAVFDVLGPFLRVHDTPSAALAGVLFGALYLGLWWMLSPHLMRWYALLATWLLGPAARTRLADRVRELAESRADTVDSQAAELRRIERDLHDGAQARLVALGMSLGMAEEIIARNPAAAAELLAEARQASSRALAELRDLVKGIHPPVLADRGLAGAVRALVLASPLPTDVDIELPGRLPAPVESAAYFAVAESLTNVAKHSAATKAWVHIGYRDGALSLRVGDDGRGGANAENGTGLRGIERRLSAFDGTVAVTSPPGGPTVIDMRLPCERLQQPATG